MQKFYDGLGSAAYLAVAIGSLCYGAYYHARQIVATVRFAASILVVSGTHTEPVRQVLVCLWTLRLGGFLGEIP